MTLEKVLAYTKRRRLWVADVVPGAGELVLGDYPAQMIEIVNGEHIFGGPMRTGATLVMPVSPLRLIALGPATAQRRRLGPDQVKIFNLLQLTSAVAQAYVRPGKRNRETVEDFFAGR